MGCDIHLYVEHTDAKADHPYWSTFGSRFNPGRDYRLFANLAGVRSYGEEEQLVPTRGLPASPSLIVKWDNELFVSKYSDGDGTCSPEDAERWIDSGISRWTDDRQVSVTHPGLALALVVHADRVTAGTQG